MKDQYDVIVVGAGPGGSIAAKTCAEGGLDVLLIEKRQEIGDPVRCAEGLSREGLKRHIKPDKKWIAAEIKGSKIISPDGTEIKLSENATSQKTGYTLERKVFDRALAQQAASAGAEVMVKTRATGLLHSNDSVSGIKAMHMGETHEIKANIVIGADGVESKIGRWGGINTTMKPDDIEVGAQFLVSNIDAGEYSKFYMGGEYAPGGYLWLFPKGDCTANVGLGILGSNSEKGKALALLRKFMKNHMPDAKILEMVVGGVPVGGPVKQTASDGLLLIGDAARQSDPLTGGGIINAMDAGKIAGDVCIKAHDTGDYSMNSLQVYEDRWRATIGKNISKSLTVKNILLKFSDEKLNQLAHSLKDEDVSKMALPAMLRVLFTKNPKMLWELRSLFK